MKYFVNTLLIFAVLLAVGGYVIREASPSTLTQATIALAIPSTPPASKCNILTQIHQVQGQLASASLQVGTKKYSFTEERVGNIKLFNDPEQSIVMGLLNLDTCTTQTVVTTQRANDLITPPGYTIQPVLRVNGIQWNDWATQYQVVQPANWFLIGVQFPYIPKNSTTITPVFYTPYTDALRVPQIIDAGKQYPMTLVTRVDAALRIGRVHSRTDPTMLITDVPELRPEYAARKLPIEHMDDTEFFLDQSATTDRVAVIMGANQDHSWSFTCSPAHACGPQQFIPSTWELMVDTFPEAHLPADFMTGARDPFWAMMATRLLDDYNLALFKRLLTADQFATLTRNPHLLEEALASAYNTGGSRTVAVLDAYLSSAAPSGDWIEAQGSGSRGHLVAQTKGYILKLRYIREHWPVVTK